MTQATPSADRHGSRLRLCESHLLRLRERRLLPPFSTLARLENQLEHRAPFFHAVNRALALAKAIGEVANLRLERIHIREVPLARLFVSARQVIERVARSEDLTLLAHDVNV